MFKIGKLVALAGILSILGACGGGSQSAAPVTNKGRFIAVEGIKYQTATRSGYTNSAGEFEYFDSETVTFSIGSINLPTATASTVMTPLTLVGVSSTTDTAVVNIARLLQTLDTDGNPTNGISISPAAHTAASGMTLSFDSPTFDIDVQALVDNSGSVTTVLVSSTNAVAYLENTLAAISPSGGQFGVKIYKPTGECNPDTISYITGLDGNPVPLTIPGGIGGTIMPYYYRPSTNSVTAGLPLDVSLFGGHANLGLIESGSDDGGPYVYQLIFPDNDARIDDDHKLYRIDWNVYPDNGSFPTHCIRSGRAQLDYEGQLKNLVIEWTGTDTPTPTDPIGAAGPLTLSAPYTSLNSQEYVYDPVNSEPTSHIWRVGTPGSQVAAAQMDINNNPGFAGELLSFYVYEGSGFTGLWVDVGDGANYQTDCVLSGTDPNNYYPLCSSWGITVNKSAGTISFNSTPAFDAAGETTGTMSGSLTFTPVSGSSPEVAAFDGIWSNPSKTVKMQGVGSRINFYHIGYTTSVQGWYNAQQKGFIAIGDPWIRNIVPAGTNKWNAEVLWNTGTTSAGVTGVDWSANSTLSLTNGGATLVFVSTSPYNGITLTAEIYKE